MYRRSVFQSIVKSVRSGAGKIAKTRLPEIENSPKNASYPAITGVKTQGSGEKTQAFTPLLAFFANLTIALILSRACSSQTSA
jgi:hypothetical protein